MSKATEIAYTLIEEGSKARAHFQIWWALRNKALPKYYRAMNNFDYVDFFHAANSGHYTLFFLSLSKIFDRDSRVAGLKEFKQALRAESRNKSALAITRALKPHNEIVKRVMAIRNKSIAHNEHGITRKKVYEINGVTPDEIRDLIDATCNAINEAARDLGINNPIFDSNRSEQATLNMLETLAKGTKVA
jgi:AbiU2